MSNDARQKFQTYLFFMRHFEQLIRLGRDDRTEENLISGLIQEQTPLLDRIAARPIPAPHTDRLRGFLVNAWNSETVARMNSLFHPDARAITNQWKPVQTYYALYFLLAAIREIHFPEHRQGHESTLRFATNTISDEFPLPWSCSYDFDNGRCHRFPWPSSPRVSLGWNLANHADPYTFVVHFYRTIGRDKRDDRWHEQGKGRRHRPGHPREGRAFRKADIRVGNISVWDVLWRIRKWVNYKEAQALLEGQEPPERAEEFDERFNSILIASLDFHGGEFP